MLGSVSLSRQGLASIPSPTQRDLDEAAHRGVVAGLDAIGQAGGLVDGRWGVLAMNATAQALVLHNLDVRDGRFAGRTRDVDLRLRRLMTGLEGACSAHAVFPRASGTALVMRATRLAHPIGQAVTLVTFTSSGETSLPGEAVLRATFGLTVAEAGVALSVARGLELKAIARARGVAIDTIRSHLRTVFAKTGTRRQAALVGLIAGLRTPSN